MVRNFMTGCLLLALAFTTLGLAGCSKEEAPAQQSQEQQIQQAQREGEQRGAATEEAVKEGAEEAAKHTETPAPAQPSN